MSHSRDGPGVMARLWINIAPLTAAWNPPPPSRYPPPPLERPRTQTLVFSNFSGTPGISAKGPGISRQEVWFFLGFEAHTELFGPHLFTWKTPTHPKISGPESLGLGFFFLPDLRAKNQNSPEGKKQGNLKKQRRRRSGNGLSFQRI